MATASDMSDISKNGISPAKIKKTEELSEEEINSVHNSLKDLSDFNVTKILSNNSNKKTICLQGSFTKRDGAAIVLLEKGAFVEKHVEPESEYFSDKSSLVKQFHNDIYGNYEFFPKPELNDIKATIIHPATDKHIEKFSVQNLYLVDETPEIYKDIVLPHLQQEQFSLDWVYNILEHKSEVERIVYEDLDPELGFVLLPDLKWDAKNPDTLYLLAITRVRNIKSLRDLTVEHLGLLRNIRDKSCQAIEEKYGLKSSQLRIYLHYRPSFYHLHIHFVSLRHEAPGIQAEKSHILCNVISNIELLKDYYQKVTLPFVVRENEKLFVELAEKNVLTKVEEKKE